MKIVRLARRRGREESPNCDTLLPLISLEAALSVDNYALTISRCDSIRSIRGTTSQGLARNAGQSATSPATDATAQASHQERSVDRKVGAASGDTVPFCVS